MDNDLIDLLEQAKALVKSTRTNLARGVNAVHVAIYYRLGRMIIEHEQNGYNRAEYGKQIIKQLSYGLSKEFGRGFSERNLMNMRRFYHEWKGKIEPRSPLIMDKFHEKAQTVSAESLSTDSPSVLSWSHYVFLMGIHNKEERKFYEIEALNNDWSIRELKRQFDSSLFERLALSRDKDTVTEMARKGQVVDKPQDLLKEPYVLEFLGLREDKIYSENEIETAIIDKLEQFLLELGKGFLFEARQKRFTFDSDHFFVDLVFYNRILRCYVLLDLKIGKLSHQDLGQMQMYVNYFDRYVRLKEENPTIGVILCREKNDAVVELTLPKNTNIYPARYQLYLPSKEELREKLIEWTVDH